MMNVADANGPPMVVAKINLQLKKDDTMFHYSLCVYSSSEVCTTVPRLSLIRMNHS